MQKRSGQAGCMESVDCLFDFAELVLTKSTPFGLDTVRELIRAFQSEGFGIHVFRTEIKKVDQYCYGFRQKDLNRKLQSRNVRIPATQERL